MKSPQGTTQNIVKLGGFLGGLSKMNGPALFLLVLLGLNQGRFVFENLSILLAPHSESTHKRSSGKHS